MSSLFIHWLQHLKYPITVTFCPSKTWLMASGRQKVVRPLFWISVSMCRSWWGVMHRYPLSPGEKEAQINLQSSQYIDKWDCASHRNIEVSLGCPYKKQHLFLCDQALVWRKCCLLQGHCFLVFTKDILKGQAQKCTCHGVPFPSWKIFLQLTLMRY